MRTSAIIAGLLAAATAASCSGTQIARQEAAISATAPPARPSRDAMDVAKPARPKAAENLDEAEEDRRSYAWHDNKGVMRYGVAHSGVIFYTIACQGRGMKLTYLLTGDGPYPERHPIRITAPGMEAQDVRAMTSQNDVMGGKDATAEVPSDGAVAKAIYAGSKITMTDRDGAQDWIPLPSDRAKALEASCATERAGTSGDGEGNRRE